MILSRCLNRICLIIILLFIINSTSFALSTPHMVKDINPNGSGGGSYMTLVNGNIYFVASDGSVGYALWKSDGTEEVTVMVKDINPDNGSTTSCGPSDLINMNGTLFFTAGNRYYYVGSHHHCELELWKSDGTEAGTVRVKDIHEGIEGSFPKSYTVANNTLFFAAIDSSSHGLELWKSDGTETGTVMVKDICPGYGSSQPEELTVVGNIIYFRANDGSGRELWKSDGTEEGTVMVKDINPVNDFYSGSDPNELTNLNGILFFNATDGIHGNEPWKSDGTEEGTVMIKDIKAGDYSSSNPSGFTAVNDVMFFLASAEKNHLWKSDGTEAGTVVVKEDVNISASLLWETNGMLFFWLNYFAAGHWELHLWKSDGTVSGTMMIKIINPYSGSNAGDFIDVNGTAFFLADDGVHGHELWKSDGTEDGTAMVADINPGIGDSYPMGLLYYNDVLYFRANDGTNGAELWALPTPTGTDDDGIPYNDDNCPLMFNPDQEDSYPPQGNGIGDACDCEGNFDCDADVDGSDAAKFKSDFGRGIGGQNQCANDDPCNGDILCDKDVDGIDVALFTSDFGRGIGGKNTCPSCIVDPWCGYQ